MEVALTPELEDLKRKVAAGIQDLEQVAFEAYKSENLGKLVDSIRAQGRGRGSRRQI